MQALPEEIESLYEVQRIDLDIKKSEKELADLPQRQIIFNARQKREQIAEKYDQIIALKKDANKKLTRISDEDASLEKKEHGVQAAIEAAGNDFRNAEARTKELNSIFNRRNELRENRAAVEEEMRKIKQLENQILLALKDLDDTEADATESFKAEGTALMKKMAEGKSAREQLLAGISPDVASFYNKTAVLFDTVVIGKLEGNSCSVCRSKIEAGHLLDLMQQAPLGICPSCKRILIIEE